MRPTPLAPALAALALALAPAPDAAALPPGYTIESLQSSLAFPVAFRFAPDGRLFYIERASGRIMTIASPWTGAPAPWATVPTYAVGERGLLGLELHPDFPDSAYVYVFHTTTGPLRNRVARLADVAGAGVGYTVVVDSLPATSGIHHGGRLAFGPDRMLYVTFGDQSSPSSSEIVTDLRGKILRYTGTGRPAPGNPFGPANPVAAYGVRNPFGLCFDPLTGTGYFTENGPQCDDEINLFQFAGDYGWGPDEFCGGQPAPSVAPLATFSPPIAPTGCCVYRGAVEPGFDGNLFFAGYLDRSIRRVVFKPGFPDEIDTLEVFHQLDAGVVLDVQVGPDGRLWFSSGSGLYRVVPGTVSVPPAAAAPALEIAPNPSRGAVTFRLGRPAAARLEIVDLAGRLIRRWEGPLPAAIEWDGRDAHGRRAQGGVYFARVRGEAGETTRAIVRLER